MHKLRVHGGLWFWIKPGVGSDYPERGAPGLPSRSLTLPAPLLSQACGFRTGVGVELPNLGRAAGISAWSPAPDLRTHPDDLSTGQE